MMRTNSTIVEAILFGKGFYELSSLYSSPEGPPISKAMLELDEQYKLMQNPVGDLNYQALAMLSCINEDMRRYVKAFFKFQAQLKEQQEGFPDQEIVVSPSLSRTYLEVNTVSREGLDYLGIDFSQISELAAAKSEPKKLFWITLQQGETEVGHVYIVNQEASLFSDQSLLVENASALQSLTVRTIEKVRLESLPVQTCCVYGAKLDIASAPSKMSSPILKTAFLEVHCFQPFEITKQSAVDVAACQIKAGQFVVRGDFECQGDMRIWTEQIDVYGFMAIRGRVIGVCLGVRYHLKDEKTGQLTNAHLHAPQIFLLVGMKHDKASVKRSFPKEIGQIELADISSKIVNLYCNQIVLRGDTWVEGILKFIAIDKRARTELKEEGQLFLNGSWEIYGKQAGVWQKGRLRESPDIRIGWKCVVNPFAAESHAVSHEPARLGQVSFIPALKPKEASAKSVELVPFQPSADKLALVVPEEKTPKSRVIFAAEHIGISGELSFSSPVSVRLFADTLNFSGHISLEKMEEEFFEPLSILMQAQAELNIQNATIDTPEDQVGVATAGSLTLKDSRIDAAQLLAGGREVSIAGEVILQGRQQLIARAERAVSLEKDAKLALLSSAPVLIQADSMSASHAQITFDTLHIRANELLQLWRVKLQGESLSVETHKFIAGLTNFSVNKQISITTAVSLMGLCIVSTDYFCNQTLVNLSFISLYKPATFKLNVRSAVTLFLAAANTGMSIAQLFVHDPVVQGALIGTRFALNAIPALITAVKLATDIYDASQKEEIDEFGAIQLVNQVKTLIATLVRLGYGSVTAIPDLSGPFAAHAVPAALPTWDETWTVINRVNDIVGQLASGILPGRNINSILDVAADVSVGLADTHNSLFSLSGSVNAAVLSSRTSLVQVDLPSSMTLTPAYSADTGLLAYQMGAAAPLPIGEHSSRYVDYHAASVLPLPEDHHNVQAYRYTAETKQTITHSAVEAEVFSEQQGFAAAESRIAAQHLDLARQTEMELQKSRLQAGDLSGGGKLVGIASDMTVGKLESEAGSVTALVGSTLNAGEVQVQKGAKLTGDAGSSFVIDKMEVKKGAEAGFRDSDLNIKNLHNEIGDIPIDWNHSLSSELPQDSHPSNHPSPPHPHETKSPDTKSHSPSPPEPVDIQNFVYQSDHSLKGYLSSDGQTIIYVAEGPVNLKGNALVSPFNLAVVTPESITVKGRNSSDASLTLVGDKITFDHAKSQLASLNAHAVEMNISGGKLDASGNVSLSGDHLTVDKAAQMAAAGDVMGDFKDVDMAGKKIVTEKTTTHHSLLGDREERTQTTTFKYTEIQSGGNMVFEARDKMNLTGVDLAAEKNLVLEAKEGLEAAPLSGANVVEKSHTTLVSSHTRSESTDVELPSHLVAGDTVLLESDKSVDVTAETVGGQQIIVKAPHINGSAPILNHAVKDVSSGLSLQLPSLHAPKFEQTPVGQVLHSTDPEGSADAISDAVTKLTTGANTVATTLHAIREHDPLAAVTALTGVNPTVSVSVGRRSFNAANQSLGAGGFYTNNLVITGEEATFSNSFGMQARHTEWHLGSMTASAADLKSVAKTSDAELSASLGLSGAPSFSASYAEQDAASDVQLSHQMALGDLTLDVNRLELLGVQPSVSHVSGHVDELTAVTSLEKSEQSGTGVGISSGGSIDWSEQHDNSQTAGITTPFATDQPLEAVASDLAIGVLTLTGENADGLHAGEVHKIPIYEVKRSDSKSIGINLGGLLSKTPSTLFSSWRYQSDSAQYQAIYNDKWQVLLDERHHTQITLPIYNSEAGRQFLQDGQWLASQLHSVVPQRPDVVQAPMRSPSKDSASELKKPQQSTSASTAELDIDFYNLYQSNQATSYQNIFDDNETTESLQDDWKVTYDLNFEELAKEAGVKASILERHYIDLDDVNYAIYKINALKTLSYSLYGFSIGINAYSIWEAENHFEEACRVAFLMRTGSAGWELGTTVLESVLASSLVTDSAIAGACTVAGPGLLIGAGIIGCIGINVAADYDWHHYLNKIEDNIETDKNNFISPLPFSIFSPSQDSPILSYINSSLFGASDVFDESDTLATDDESLTIRAGLPPVALPYDSPEEIQPVYRGSLSDPEKVFNTGFTARGENTDLFSHVMNPEGYLVDSTFISTSTDKWIAASFPKAPFETDRSYVYEIFSTRSTIDIQQEFAARFERGEIDEDYCVLSESEGEKAFTSRIFPHEIRGGWEVSRIRERTTSLEDLPAFTAFWDQEAIDDLCYEYRYDIGKEFISNPHFISPSSIGQFWSVAKTIGYTATGVGLILDATSLYHEFQKSSQGGDYNNTYRESARIGGGWAGAFAMGSLYAEVGAIVCAPLTPFAQAACGVGMGLVGSVGGYYEGSGVGMKIYSNMHKDNYMTRNTFREDSDWTSGLQSVVTFFKPSTWLQRQEIAPVEFFSQRATMANPNYFFF